MRSFVLWFTFWSFFWASLSAHGQYRSIAADEVTGIASAQNLLLNPGGEQNFNNWTASGGTFGRTANNTIRGLGSLIWDPSNTGQTLTSSAITIPNGLRGANGVVSCRIRADSLPATHTIGAWDGTNTVASSTITAVTSGSARTSVNFVFPSSGTIAIRFTGPAGSSEPNILIDDCYLGAADTFNVSQVNQSEIYGTFTYAQNASCFWNKTANDWNSFSAATCGTGTATGYALAPSSTLPAIRFSNLPPGRYEVSVNATIRADYSLSATSCLYAISDGTTRKSVVQGYATANSGGPSFSLEANFDYTTVQSSLTFEVLANRVAGGGNCYVLNNDFSDMTFNIVVKRFPTNSELAYRSDLTDWFVIADITGANPSLGIANVSSYTEITDAGLTMTPVSGSQPVGIMCSSTNAAASPSTGATTCSAGSESLGASFNIPVAGWYETCFDVSHRTQLDSTETVQVAFQAIETPTNAQTVTQECGPRISVSQTAINISGGIDATNGTAFRACGQCNFSSVGTKGVRLMYEQLVAGTPDSSEVMADAGGTVGQRAIRVTVRPMRQSMSTPLLVGSVMTGGSGVTRTEYAYILGSATTPTVNTTSSPWISSITRNGIGDYTLNLTAGYFTGQLICNVTVREGLTASRQIISSTFTAVSNSSIRYRMAIIDDGGGSTTTVTDTDSDSHVSCFGAR